MTSIGSQEASLKPSQANTLRPWLWFFLFALLALTIRLMGIGRLELWNDEACSVLTATSPRGIWHELRSDTNAPLYFLLLKGWIFLWGITASGVRSLSALFGTAAIVVLGLWVLNTVRSWKTALWTMALSTIAPMQLYYSQEARSYALVLLLVPPALWTYTLAMQSMRWRDWLLHGLVMLAAFFTHNLFLPWAIAFWIASIVLGAKWKQFAGLALAHALAFAAYAPGALLMWGQATRSGGTDWIASYWQETPPALAIPKSLEVLSIGGKGSTLIRWFPMNDTWRWIGMGLVILVACAALLPRKRKIEPETPLQTPQYSKFIWILVIFTLWPLIDLWLYSALRKPLYIVARYDIFALPPLLSLLAVGLTRMTCGLSQLRVRPFATGWGWIVAFLLIGIMGWGGWRRYTAQLDASNLPHVLLGEFMQTHVNPEDMVICMSLEGSTTSYQCQLRGIDCKIRTLPTETLDHLGWVENPESIAHRHDEILAQVDGLLQEASLSKSHQLWVVIAPENAFPWERTPAGMPELITQMFFDRATANGWSITPEPRSFTQFVHISALQK